MEHSIGGAQCYITCIDDCTRNIGVYFPITKTTEEISAKFRHYQAWVETQGFHIKRFRSDNGYGEYSNSGYLELLGGNRITLAPSPSVHPKQEWSGQASDPDTEYKCTKYDV